MKWCRRYSKGNLGKCIHLHVNKRKNIQSLKATVNDEQCGYEERHIICNNKLDHTFCAECCESVKYSKMSRNYNKKQWFWGENVVKYNYASSY